MSNGFVTRRLKILLGMLFFSCCLVSSSMAAVLLSENFEDGLLDSRISVAKVGSFSTNPGIDNITNFGSTKAFGFGRSSCGASCFNGYVTSFKITLPSPTYVSTLSFKDMELYGNWGSGGKIYIDGVSLTPEGNPPPFNSGFSWSVMDFGRNPGNDGQPDTTYRSHSFPINKVATVIELKVGDITSSSEIFIDDLVITSTPPVGWIPVETITIDGTANCLPDGAAIHKDYGPGVYQFALLTGPGISYNTPSAYKPTNSAFIMVLENDKKTGQFHSFGLNSPDGQTKATIASNASTLGVDFFVEDMDCSDNSGSVNVSVRKWFSK